LTLPHLTFIALLLSAPAALAGALFGDFPGKPGVTTNVRL